MTLERRHFLLSLLSAPLLLPTACAQATDTWSVEQVHAALQADRIRLLDIRSPAEWSGTGVAQGAWPLSLYADRFAERLAAAGQLAHNRPLALICATGGRSASLLRALRQSGQYKNHVDVPEGMLGSRHGPGWIAAGLPVVDASTALAALPAALV